MLFHHASLLTGDLTATDAFYTQRLGLRRVKNSVNQENLHMRHVFYGDALGTPGTVITFFAVPRLGPRYDGANYMSGLGLAIPQDSVAYWTARLGSLHVVDPNGVAIRLIPTAGQVPHPVAGPVPAAAQIIGLAASQLFVAQPTASTRFFQRLSDSVPSGLTIAPSNSTATHRFGRGSIDHLAFTVADAHALDALEARAAAAGDPIEERIDRGWFESLYVRDPNGNRIEFATPTPGFTLDEPEATLGEDFGLPPHLEAQRAAITAWFAAQGEALT
ncbi:VOC family protein [Lacticaseibacillus absianus]|uniref:VOC family protein n=1 Tax=Lacticaseibacillus absianus TaxID=2729623 RepID=UPI0015CBC331|nr:VOC family protein [Lacticaseibacillus absianus]